MITFLRCRLFGHQPYRFRGTFYLSCIRCGEWGRIA